MTTSSFFSYSGVLPASKSMLNRLLVIRAYASGKDYLIMGDSSADDVVHMKEGLASLERSEPADCGEGGTVFRFLALRASRLAGRHHLTGKHRLFSRPIDPMLDILDQLGVKAHLSTVRGKVGDTPSLVIESSGAWDLRTPIRVDRSRSSQFASGILLNAWDLPSAVQLKFTGDAVSGSYFQMTETLVRRSGMDLETSANGLCIPPGQSVRAGTYRAESDLSSAFALTAAAAVCGKVDIEEFPARSLQPDRVFVDILKKMDVPVTLSDGTLHVGQASALQPVDWSLRDSPDLFPVLGVLAALAEGKSRLHGAPHLTHKESDRIGKTAELLQTMGRSYEAAPDGLVIHGEGFQVMGIPTLFNPDHDHRLAMAAGVAMKADFPIRVSTPEVVTKSFPDFWSCIGIAP